MVVAAIRVVLLWMVCALAWGQDGFPAKLIKLVVSFTPGGGAGAMPSA